MEKIKMGIVSMIILLFLGGCSLVDKKFNDEASAKKYSLENLEKKYGEVFESDLDKEDSFQKYPTKTVFIGHFYPKSNRNEKITVRSLSDGTVEEDYAQYKYGYIDEATEKIKNLLMDIEFERVTVEFGNNQTEDNFSNSSLSVESYVEQVDAFYEVNVYLKDGLVDESYAEIIKQILDVFYTPLQRFDLRVYANEELLILYSYATVSTDSGKIKQRISEEDILAEIKEQREDNEYMDKYFDEK